MKQRRPTPHQQRGVAVIIALLLTTLAITIVASLFWQQQVQVRLIENQRLQLQKQWILLGALDWAGLILREDAKYSNVDTLNEPWAAPLAETPLDQYVENGKTDTSSTNLSGTISDAQALFNLTNLCPNGIVDPIAVATFGRLLTLLQIDPALAQTAASQIALAPSSSMLPSLAQQASAVPATGLSQNAAPVLPTTPVMANSSNAQVMGYTQVEDLLAVPGFSLSLLNQLKPYVIFLPGSTPVNINTASAEVIAAMTGMSLSSADTLVVARQTLPFSDLANVSSRLPNNAFNVANMSVNSSYFLVNAKVHMNLARLDMQALLQRMGIATRLLWIREF
ncbi:MAG: type II secretion system minor pseudopilin GspK [Gallionella sp.]|nr:type II secretion system minor pseudopilin GspK [Gallionella sp.]